MLHACGCLQAKTDIRVEAEIDMRAAGDSCTGLHAGSELVEVTFRDLAMSAGSAAQHDLQQTD